MKVKFIFGLRFVKALGGIEDYTYRVGSNNLIIVDFANILRVSNWYRVIFDKGINDI